MVALAMAYLASRVVLDCDSRFDETKFETLFTILSLMISLSSGMLANVFVLFETLQSKSRAIVGESSLVSRSNS